MSKLLKSKNNIPEKTEFGPGKTPLYYNNVGLFSDPFLEDRLPNLEKYYNKSSTKFLNSYWNIDEFDAEKYNKSFQDIMDLWIKLDKDIPKWCKNERQLQNRWIDKIFEYLGWTIELEETISKHGVTNFPDYGLYKDFKDLSKSKNLSNKFKKALAVADAKAWGVNLDGKGFSNKNPSYQIINYLKQTDKKWGILTDGQYWRIYSTRSDSKHTTYYEIDLIKILRTADYDRFKYFFNFFRVEAFEPQATISDRCFLDFVFEDGQFYSQRVEQNLQDRVYKVVDSICHGFLEKRKNLSEDDLKEVYEYSMYYLFKLMFVLNCESKGLLEVNKQDDYYEFSLRKKCMGIKEQFEEGKNWSSQPRTYNYIADLFNLLKYGDEKIGVHGFGEEPFEIGSDEFYSKYKISDEKLNNALLELSCDFDEEDNLQFIDYKILSPDHLGSLFEGLLEFNLIQKNKKIELLNTKGDRKSTGSYYTPGYLVDYIVEETLSSLVENKNTNEILKLKVLDPSMGSGHFLLGVVRYLENHIIELQNRNKKFEGAIDFDKLRKEIIKKCVFGVDINRLATQLAKFSLWIFSSGKGDVLEPLSDQLITKNALLDKLDWSEDFENQISEGSVDAIVGNPPYIGEKGNKEIFELVKSTEWGDRYYQGKMDYFYFFFHKGLDLLRENGRLSFITTNYFSTADGALKLRKDLYKRSCIMKVVNFNDFKIFKSAQGQHNQITFVKKSIEKNVCTYFNIEGKGRMNKDLLNKVLVGEASSFSNINSNDLYAKRTFNLLLNSGNDSVINKMTKCSKLIDNYNINQGLVSGADKVTNRHISKFGVTEKKGYGIFVVDKSKFKCPSIKSYLKPFFKNSDIKQYACSSKSNKRIIYLDRRFQILPDGLLKHLKKFKKVLNIRREVKSGSMPWYRVHWPRTKDIFEKPKIVCPQRSLINTFAYTEESWYASADVYFITCKNADFSLKPLLAILNSKLYYYWLHKVGKRKGKYLELYFKPLCNTPLPILDNKTRMKLTGLVDKLILKDCTQTRNEIDGIVFKLFGLSNTEVKQVEKYYFKNIFNEENACIEDLVA